MKTGQSQRRQIPGAFENEGGIPLGLEQSSDPGQRLAEDEVDSVHGSEDISGHGKGAPPDPSEEQGGTPGLKNPPLNAPHLQVGIGFPINAYEVPMAFEVVQALGKIPVCHDTILLGDYGP